MTDLLLVEGLKESLESQVLSNVQKIELRIPRDIYMNMFGGMFTYLQESMGRLCGRYGLEMSATNNENFTEYPWQEHSPAIIVILKRDFDNPNYQKKLKELKDEMENNNYLDYKNAE